MDRRIILSPDAEAHVKSASRWYELKELNLSSRFGKEISKPLRRIVQTVSVSDGSRQNSQRSHKTFPVFYLFHFGER